LRKLNSKNNPSINQQKNTKNYKIIIAIFAKSTKNYKIIIATFETLI